MMLRKLPTLTEDRRMTRISFFSHCVMVTFLIGSRVSGEDDPPPRSSLVLVLKANKESFAKGTVPSFRFTIENQSKMNLKVPKLSNDRQGLYWAFFSLRVYQNGKKVSLDHVISDPREVTDKDFMVLKAGEKVTYELKEFPEALDRLPTGEYTGVVRISAWGGNNYSSQEVQFKIVERTEQCSRPY
jgi:hypothetical protein